MGTQTPDTSETSFLHPHYPESFITRLNATIRTHRENTTTGCLLVIQISNFAMLLNSHGAQNCHALMEELQQALHTQLEPDMWVMRIQRDQFAIALPSTEKASLYPRIRKLHETVRNFGSHTSIKAVHTTCAIASVDIPASAQDALEALDKAYIALHSGNARFHRRFESTGETSARWKQNMGLAHYLRQAIVEERLRLAYQPVIDSTTGETVHYEALLRVVGKDGTINSAGPLVPIAERMGLIDMIDMTVLERVVDELQAAPNLVLAMNVSNLTAENPIWMERFKELMQEYPSVASRLIIEITETAAHRDLGLTAYFVAELQAQGARVALDDFGSGYTSFRQLKALSVDMIKIDGEFIKDLVDNGDNRFFVRTMLDLTNGFGLKSVAEYVESGEVAKMLIELGVHYMQGYYFGRPENQRSWLCEGEYVAD